MLFLLYRTVVTLAFPFVLLYLWRRSRRDPRYARHLGERLGFLPGIDRWTPAGGIWLHAVSVGEVLAAFRLIDALRHRFPGRPVFVSVATVAGRELAEKKLAGVVDGVFYAPLDLVWAVRRTLRRIRPAAVVIFETEIWPNLWREARRFGATLTVVNGRISNRAWPRYRRWRWFFQPVLGLPDQILVQSRQDEERYRQLGAPRVSCPGNLKYDFEPPRAAPPEIAAWAGSGPLWIAASTMPPDEERQVIAAFRLLPADTKLILAPRRPERFEEAARELTSAGIPFVRRTELVQRTELAASPSDGRVLLLNTIGELAACFALPSVVFVGGSLVDWGGHNLLEPAIWGRPIVGGPYWQNFADMAAEFREAGALTIVRDPAELAQQVTRLLAGDTDGTGLKAQRLAGRFAGLAARVAAGIPLGEPLTHPPLRPLLWLLSRCWLAGLTLDRWTNRCRRLPKPVVSVGGLAMGGAGKTPVVLHLAKRLHQEGVRVGILLRGYGRKGRQPLVLPPGTVLPPDETGDEAQLYLAAGHAWVGIGPDRYQTGRAMADQVDLFLLDDGFQHWALARDLDLLLLDPLDPNAGGGLFPLGRLREPRDAARRADFVLTPEKAVTTEIPPGRYSALCAIGNPSSFRKTLAQLPGVEIGIFRAFPDHHSFVDQDWADLPRPILTTSKDAARLPPGATGITVVQISLVLPEEDRILDRIWTLLGRTRSG